MKIIDERKVKFRGQIMSLTAATRKVLKAEGQVRPTPFWMFGNRNLLDIYDETYPPDDD